MSRSRATTARHRGGFTLVEMIVVVLVLVVVAGLSVPGYSAIRNSATDSRTTLTVDAVMRHALTSAAFQGVSVFSASDLAGSTTSAADGSGATSPIVASTSPSEGYGQLSYQISTDGRLLGLAMLSETSTCIYGLATIPNGQVTWTGHGECSGSVALLGEGGDSSTSDSDDDEPPPAENAGPSVPSGEPLATHPSKEVTGTFTVDPGDADAVTYAVSLDGEQWNATTDASSDLTVSIDGEGVTVELTATPGPLSVGTFPVWLRASTVYGTATSEFSVISTCSDSPFQPAGSVCARPTGTAALLGGWLSLENQNIIAGDVYIVGHVTLRHRTDQTEIVPSLDAQGNVVGRGDLFAGSLDIPNGANTSIAGSVVLDGEFTNNSPQTVIGGSLTSYAGSLYTRHSIPVSETVAVNDPNTITGDFGTSGVVTDGEVPQTGRPLPLKVDDRHITYDVEFATFSEFTTWWSSNKDNLGKPGVATIKVNGTGTVPSGGTLHGDALIVVTGDLTVAGLPQPADGSRILTIATTGELAVGTGTSAVGLTTHLHADGAVDVNQQTIYTGTLSGETIDIAQHFELNGRLIGGHAGLVLWQQGFTDD